MLREAAEAVAVTVPDHPQVGRNALLACDREPMDCDRQALVVPVAPDEQCHRLVWVYTLSSAEVQSHPSVGPEAVAIHPVGGHLYCHPRVVTGELVRDSVRYGGEHLQAGRLIAPALGSQRYGASDGGIDPAKGRPSRRRERPRAGDET